MNSIITFVNIDPKLTSKIKTTANNHNYYLQKLQSSIIFLAPTDSNEIQSIIYHFSPHKAENPDKIPVRVIKLGAKILSYILSNLINKALQAGIFPKSLKIARVTLIFKGGNSELANNYRPISIISAIPKLFGKLISRCLIKHLNKFNIINDKRA
jgi:hypothetical protein